MSGCCCRSRTATAPSPTSSASLKTISEDGGFEIKNLMRGNDALPVPKLRTIIDRDLFHRAPGRIPSGDLIEFG